MDASKIPPGSKVLFPPFFEVLSRSASKLSGQGLLAFQEEAVKYIARVEVPADDRPRRVGNGGEGPLVHACTCARSIERSDDTVTSAHEAVIHLARVNVISRNRPYWVDALAERTLAGACTRTWNIERGDGAVSGAHEAVSYVARVKEHARDGPRRVDACCTRALAHVHDCPRAWSIERRDGAVRSAHEAVNPVLASV
jgi:hypothetical protein